MQYNGDFRDEPLLTIHQHHSTQEFHVCIKADSNAVKYIIAITATHNMAKLLVNAIGNDEKVIRTLLSALQLMKGMKSDGQDRN